jgi:hypothetical protein
VPGNPESGKEAKKLPSTKRLPRTRDAQRTSKNECEAAGRPNRGDKEIRDIGLGGNFR